MNLSDLNVFLTVAAERGFSRAAVKLHRTQPAVSQGVARLEAELGERLFDRSSKDGKLTEAGRVLQNYGERLARLAEEAESAVKELKDLRRGRVLIGANESAVHTLLPLIARFRARYPRLQLDVRRVPARQIATEVSQGSLDFGVLTFEPAEPNLTSVGIGSDELVLLVHPSDPLARRKLMAMEDFRGLTVVAHNDPSPARERVLRLFEQRHVPLDMLIALPSLDGIKRAVEMRLGVALLPRRCAVTEIARGGLVAIRVGGISRRRRVKLVCRRSQMSQAAAAFLATAQENDRRTRTAASSRAVHPKPGTKGAS